MVLRESLKVLSKYFEPDQCFNIATTLLEVHMGSNQIAELRSKMNMQLEVLRSTIRQVASERRGCNGFWLLPSLCSAQQLLYRHPRHGSGKCSMFSHTRAALQYRILPTRPRCPTRAVSAEEHPDS